MTHSYLTTENGRKVAYVKTAGSGPGIVFLGGFRSDMSGTKASFLETWAIESKRAFVRFDYSGHGQSEGEFEDGCVGDWFRDARNVLLSLTEGPQIIVGSSMGGWIGLLLARQMPDKIAGFVGISAAPDFTEDAMWGSIPPAQRKVLVTSGKITVPSDYTDTPYVISWRLIEDGRAHMVLREPLRLNCPTRLLHGTGDTDVSPDVAVRLLNHLDCDNLQLILVKAADHRFSTKDNLALIIRAIEDVSFR